MVFEPGPKDRTREYGVADAAQSEAFTAKRAKGLSDTGHRLTAGCRVKKREFEFGDRALLGKGLTVVGKPASHPELPRVAVVDVIE